MELNDLATKQDFAAYLAKAFPSFATPAELLENFKHAQPETRAAVERAYAVRADFGLWDEFDPIANAIIELAAAQNAVTANINQDAESGDGDIASAAVARVGAIIGLVDALAVAIRQQITGAAELEQDALIELACKLTASVNHLHNLIGSRQ